MPFLSIWYPAQHGSCSAGDELGNVCSEFITINQPPRPAPQPNEAGVVGWSVLLHCLPPAMGLFRGCSWSQKRAAENRAR